MPATSCSSAEICRGVEHFAFRGCDNGCGGTVVEKAILGCKIRTAGILHGAFRRGRWDKSRSVFVVVLRLSRAIWVGKLVEYYPCL